MQLLEGILNNDLGVTIVVFGLIVTVVVLIIVVKFIFPDGSEDKKEKLRVQSRRMLLEATKLQKDDYGNQAVIQAHKAIETVMKGMLNENTSSFDAIKKLQKKKLLSPQNIDRAHNLRIQRNKSAHGDSRIKSQRAKEMVSDAHSIISQLLR